MNIDEAIQVSCIIDKLSPSWKDFKHTLKHKKEELTLIELDSHLRIEESLKVHDSDKPKSNNGTKTDPNKKSKVTCWKYGKPVHLKKDCKGGKVGNKANGLGMVWMIMLHGGLNQEQQFMCVNIDADSNL
ncbi:hypothetical protein Tco_0547754 [Tanacetum coccineum]